MANFGKRYELIERIGSGGTGEVWLAHDERLGGRPVAIKIMHQHVPPNEDDVNRFGHETRLAAMLDHPNIVTIYATGTDNDAPFIVMEYLEGQDLDMALPRGDHERVAAIGRDICGALAYAHGKGVIHGDIKPGNVVLLDTGQVKVTDFGIARAVSGRTLGSPRVHDGMLSYRSPEQWRGEAPAFSDDIWAVGCLLYRLISGRLPRVLPGAADYTAAANGGDPVSDLRDISTAPDWLTAAVMAMLDPDPAGRATADDGVRLLSRGPSPAPVAAQATADRRRRPSRVISAIAVAVVLLLAGSITAWRFGTASRTSRPTLSKVVVPRPSATGAASVTTPAASAGASRSSSAGTGLPPSAATSSSRSPSASSSRSASASPSGSLSASPSASSPSSRPRPRPSSPPASPPIFPSASPPGFPSGSPPSSPAAPPPSTPPASAPASAPPPAGAPTCGPPPPPGAPPPPPGGPQPCAPPSGRPPRP